MKTQRVKQTVEVEVPDGYILVPDKFKQWIIYFQDQTQYDGYVKLRVLLKGVLPDKIGPYIIERKEMGGASYKFDEGDDESRS